MELKLVDVSSSETLECDPINIDLTNWIENNFSTFDYRNAAKGHWAMAVSNDREKGKITVNVESIGGHLMIQNYVTDVRSADHLKFVSTKTDFWIFHIAHIFVKVITDIRINPNSKGGCSLSCKVRCITGNPVIWFFSKLCLTNFFVGRHCIEETRSFAGNLMKEISLK